MTAVIVASAILAFLITTALPLLRRWRRRRARAAQPPAPIAAIATVPLVPLRRPTPPPVPEPSRPSPRRTRRLTPAEARRAIVLATVLGPCRGIAPRGQDAAPPFS